MNTAKSIMAAIDLMKADEKEICGQHINTDVPIEQLDDRFGLPAEHVRRLFDINKTLAIQKSQTGWLAAFHDHFLDIDFVDYLANIDPRHHRVLHNKNVFAYLGTDVIDAIEGLLIEYKVNNTGTRA